MSDSIPTLRSFGTRWDALDLAVPVPLLEGQEYGPKADLHVALIRDNDTGHIYTDDLPVVLRAKFAGGTALRGLDIALNVTQVYSLYQIAKLLPDAQEVLFHPGDENRMALMTQKVRERWDKARKEAAKVPRNLYYQSQLIYTCLFAPLKGRTGLYEARAKTGRLEWKHKKKKSKLLMPCCHPLTRAMIKRSNTDDNSFTFEGAQRTVLAERDLLLGLAPGSVSRQFFLYQWVGTKSANFKTTEKHRRIVDPRGWNSAAVAGTRGEFFRRLRRKEAPLFRGDSSDLDTEDVQERFRNTSFAAPGNLVLWNRDYCVATCMLWAKEMLALQEKLEDGAHEELLSAAQELATRLGKGASAEAAYEQAVYRALIGKKVAPKTWSRYRKALHGQAVNKEKVPLFPLIQAYDQLQEGAPDPELRFRSYAIQQLDHPPSVDEWAVITELDPLFSAKYGFDENPQFQFRLDAKNALGQKHGVQFRLSESVEPGTLYLINQPEHTLMTLPFKDGSYLVFEPARGAEICDEAPWKSGTPLLEVYLSDTDPLEVASIDEI